MFARLFLDHPTSVGESYCGHAVFALRFAGLLFAAAGAAVVHAILPFMFETTASRIIKRLHGMTAHRSD